jgi:rod shape-determining protein MreC
MKDTRRARLVLTILLLLAFTLITLDFRSGALSGGRSVGSDIFGPIENTVDDVVHPIGSWFSSLGRLGSYKGENQKLERELAAANRQLRLGATQRSQLLQARKLLHLAGKAQYRIVPAQVVAYGGADGFDYTVTINRGSDNGIATQETVINGDGLVGRTTVVSQHSATIQLADDPTFQAGVKLSAPKEEAGFVAGAGRGQPLRLTVIDPNASVQVNQQVVTLGSTLNPKTGLNEPFVPEIPIGHVSFVTPPHGGLSVTGKVVPYVDYTSLDLVAVVVKAPSSPIKPFSLVPTSPTPAPTVTVTVTSRPHPHSSSPSGTPSGTPSVQPSGTP